MLKGNGFAASVGSSVAIKMENASKNGDQGRKDLGRFATSQCSSLGYTDCYVFSANCSTVCYYAPCV